MKEFFKSFHCTSGVHCSSCRSIDDSSFRDSILKKFDDVSSDMFECPVKKPWGFKVDNKIAVNKTIRFVTADLIIKNIDKLSSINGLKDKIDSVNLRIKEANCSRCVANRMKGEIVSFVSNHIVKYKDLVALSVFDESLNISHNNKSYSVSELSKEIEKRR